MALKKLIARNYIMKRQYNTDQERKIDLPFVVLKLGKYIFSGNSYRLKIICRCALARELKLAYIRI